MTPRRKLLLILGLGALAAAVPAAAQQPARVWRIGFLSPSSAAGAKSRVEALRAGLRELGYVEGKNIAIEFRWAEDKYERLPALAAELVRLKPDVIVTQGAPGARAAKGATATIPIVMGAVGDAVGVGLVADLARPGGNITGSTFFIFELYAKRIELLKEALPRAKRFGLLLNPDSPSSAPAFAATERAVRPLRIELQRFEARAPGEFDSAFSAMARRGIGAVAIQEDPLFIAHAKAIAQLAATRRMPVASGPELAQAGGLLGYGPSVPEMYRRAAYFVDRILKGAKPGDLPVEMPTRFELAVDMRAAKALGIKLPQSFLARADRVIE